MAGFHRAVTYIGNDDYIITLKLAVQEIYKLMYQRQQVVNMF